MRSAPIQRAEGLEELGSGSRILAVQPIDIFVFAAPSGGTFRWSASVVPFGGRVTRLRGPYPARCATSLDATLIALGHAISAALRVAPGTKQLRVFGHTTLVAPLRSVQRGALPAEAPAPTFAWLGVQRLVVEHGLRLDFASPLRTNPHWRATKAATTEQRRAPRPAAKLPNVRPAAPVPTRGPRRPPPHRAGRRNVPSWLAERCAYGCVTKVAFPSEKAARRRRRRLRERVRIYQCKDCGSFHFASGHKLAFTD